MKHVSLTRRQWPWQRRKFLCPYCGGGLFTVEVTMDRRPNRMARITSISGLITCTGCGLGTAYDDFVVAQRGWLLRDTSGRGIKTTGRLRHLGGVPAPALSALEPGRELLGA